MNIKIKRCHPDAIIPTKGTPESAAYDLYLTSDIEVTRSGACAGTGICLEIPGNFYGLVLPRSSLCQHNVQLLNTIGLIDSDYRGEIKLLLGLIKCGKSVELKKGMRVAQLLITQQYYRKVLGFEEVEELGNTQRSTGGLGSTGR